MGVGVTPPPFFSLRRVLAHGMARRMTVTSTILQTLHQDHANQLQLLSLVETEIGKLDDVSDPADFELLSLALEYCSDFPNRYHHHKEDRIYE